MSPDVDTEKSSALPGSPFNLLSSELYLWRWPSRLNPLKSSQRQRPLELFIKITCLTSKNYVTRCHQMLIRQNQIYCQVAHSICYYLSIIYGGDSPALILWNYLKDNDPLTFLSKSHVRHSKTMSPDVDTTKPSTLPGSPFNLLSSELYLWGWPFRLNPLKLSQRKWPLDLFIKITSST